jgi:hypothetical protein
MKHSKQEALALPLLHDLLQHTNPATLRLSPPHPPPLPYTPRGTGLTTGDHRPHHRTTPPQSSEMPGGGDGGGCPRGGKGACPGGLPGGGNGAGAREGNAPTGTPPGPSPRPPAPDPSLAPPWDRGSKATHWPGSLVAPGREGGNREAASLGRTWSPALPPTPHAAPTPGSGSRGGDASGGAWVGPSEVHCAALCGSTTAAST